MNKIEQSIEDIFDFLDSCKTQPLSNNKLIVPKDEIFDLIESLRLMVPDEIKRYNKVVSNREAILADAEKKAAVVVEDAKKKLEGMVNEQEVVQQAYEHANHIVNEASQQATDIRRSAEAEAEQLRENALRYANDLLKMLEATLQGAYNSSMANYKALTDNLKVNLDTVKSNISELGIEENKPVVKEDVYEDEDEDYRSSGSIE
ncbi:MAG: ATPase [Lachnospiraceae bacterium]|nr:ATPase [Lachnospiraceae bacterium]